MQQARVPDTLEEMFLQTRLARRSIHGLTATTALYLVGEGSGGVFWLNDDACYRYFQPMNPGGYALTKLQITPDELNSEIEGVGLAVAEEWGGKSRH